MIREKPDFTTWTTRELKTLDMLLKGMKPKDIACELGIEAGSVYGYVNRVYMRFNCTTKTQSELVRKYNDHFPQSR